MLASNKLNLISMKGSSGMGTGSGSGSSSGMELTGSESYLRGLKDSIYKLVQLSSVHAQIIQNEKYSFQHSNNLLSSYLKLSSTLSKSLTPTALSSTTTTPNSSNDNLHAAQIDKESKNLFCSLRCLSVAQRTTQRCLKNTFRQDKIPNLTKNIQKMTVSVSPNATVGSEVLVSKIVEEARRWNSVKPSAITGSMLIDWYLKLMEMISNVMGIVKLRRPKLFACNDWVILQLRFGMVICFFSLILSGAQPAGLEEKIVALIGEGQTLGLMTATGGGASAYSASNPAYGSSPYATTGLTEQNMALLRRMIASFLLLVQRLLSIR